MSVPRGVDKSMATIDTNGTAARQEERPEAGILALIAAYEAALSVATELNLEAVLQRIADLAREVVPSRYAALGVADEEGRIVTFTTSGITPEERVALGPIPQGHGLLGELIERRMPLIVPDIESHPRSVGFPEGHPKMKMLLGVPILSGERAVGNLYLTERLGRAQYGRDDLRVVEILAAHAATAIERARLHGEIETERRQAEEQRDQLRVILDTMPSGVLIQSATTGEIELANESAIEMLRGVDAHRGGPPANGRDIRLLRDDGAPLDPSQGPADLALRGEVVRNRQVVLERTDGTRLPILIQAAPLRDADGAISRAVVMFQDVTRLREAEQLKDDFLSLVSHEFRTPLTAIHGGAHLLARQVEGLDPETRHELLEDVVTESGRLVRMLDNMLSLAATMAGRTELRTEPVLLEPLIRRVAAEVGERSPGYDFAVELPGGLPPVEGDDDRLAQVLGNLYENAVKYSPVGSRVRTTASSDGATVTVEVADEGVGIAPEHVPHVFERFRRPGADPSVRGMGLGLYLSRLLVTAQGGSIAARSAGVGKGAVFAITLPVARWWSDDDGDHPAAGADPCAHD